MEFASILFMVKNLKKVFLFIFVSLSVSLFNSCWWFDSGPGYRLILQGQYVPEGVDLSPLCVSNQAMSLHGSNIGCFGADDPVTIEEFINHSEEDMRYFMQGLVNNNPELNNSSMYMELNCENPWPLADWGLHNDDPLQEAYFDSLALRLSILREYFPQAIISIGPVSGNGNGGMPQTLIDKIEALNRAGERGVFDHITCIEARVFLHRGEDDEGQLEDIVAYAIQSIEIASSLTNSTGQHLPVCVVGNFFNNNGNSNNPGAPITVEQALVQLNAILTQPNVLVIGWWHPGYNESLQWPILEGLNLCGG